LAQRAGSIVAAAVRRERYREKDPLPAAYHSYGRSLRIGGRFEVSSGPSESRSRLHVAV
jgi:hypothetical protein